MRYSGEIFDLRASVGGRGLLFALFHKQALVVLPVGDHNLDLPAELIDKIRSKYAYVFLAAGFGEID
jgi:hypothetical protein